MRNLIVLTALCFSFSSFAQAPAVSVPAPAAAVAPASAAPAAAVAVVPAVVAPAAPLLAPPPANTIPYVQIALNYVESIPAAGKILSIIFQVLGILGAVGTALISILLIIQAAFASAGKAVWAPLGVAANWIEAVLPWVKYASLYKPAPAVVVAVAAAPAAVAAKKV
jgi:hypothetical protein